MVNIMNVWSSLEGDSHHLILLFGPAFSPYSIFQWSSQSKETLLNISMKCCHSWNGAFNNAQGSRLILVVVHVGAEKTWYVVAVEALRKKARQDETQLSLLSSLLEKLVWVLVILFCKISFLVIHFMPYYAEADRSHPLVMGLYG
jgi:hypothetical protein